MTSIWKKQIGKKYIRKYAFNVDNLLKRGTTMSKQAKTLTSVDVKRILDFIALKKHAARNRAMFLVTLYAGLRVGEVASLRYMDVLGVDDEVRDEIRLDASVTKNNEARTVFVNAKALVVNAKSNSGSSFVFIDFSCFLIRCFVI